MPLFFYNKKVNEVSFLKNLLRTALKLPTKIKQKWKKIYSSKEKKMRQKISKVVHAEKYSAISSRCPNNWLTQVTTSAPPSLSPKTPIRHGLHHLAPPPPPPSLHLPSSSLPSQPLCIRRRRFSIGFEPQLFLLLRRRRQQGELQWRGCDLCEDQGQDIRHHACLFHDRIDRWEAVLWAGTDTFDNLEQCLCYFL